VLGVVGVVEDFHESISAAECDKVPWD
jgi:hypothetical protein